MPDSSASADGFGDLKIVDADTHYSEPHDLWTSRAPARWRSRVPRVERDANGRDWWHVDDKRFGPAGAASIVRPDGSKQKFWEIDLAAGLQHDEVHEASYDPRARTQMMDQLGIWAQIVYPNLPGFGVQHLLKIEDLELRNAIVSIYNDAAAELQRDSGQRLFPQALLPFWDIETAVSEVQRAKEELGLTGIVMCSDPDLAGLPDIPDAYWDPLWEVCGALSMPINLHVGASDISMRRFKESAWPSQDRFRKIVVGSLQIELENARVLSNLLTCDVLVRHPDTRWVSVESGIGWIPYMLERLEYQLCETLPEDESLLHASPTELFRRQVYGCFWFEDVAPRKLLEDIGVDNVMFETDFPHPTCLYPSPREHAERVLAECGPEVCRKVMQDNAAKLYGLPI